MAVPKISPLDLGSVTLKKTSGPDHDASAPRVDLSDEVSEKQRNAYQSRVLEANAEEWVSLLGNLTFPTTFMPLTEEDAQFFIDAYHCLGEQKCKELPDALERHKCDLVSRLEPVMQKAMKSSGLPYVFVKLSSRSAKDAPVTQKERLEKGYRALLESLVKQGKENSLNTRLEAMLTAATDMLKMRNATQVLEFCMHSERIWQDMLLAMDQKQHFRENFVVREWTPIDVDMEFRGFVHGGRLQCISYYNHLMYSERVVLRQKELATLMKTFFDTKVAPLLHQKPELEDCVLDFAVVNENEVLVIEINPFLDSTDGCLFSWARDGDILRNGPFELRVRPKADPSVAALVAHEWRAILQDEELNRL